MKSDNRDFSDLIADYLATDSSNSYLYSVKDLLKKYSIDTKKFYCILKRNKVTTRNKSFDMNTRLRVVSDYMSGVSIQSIMNKYSLCITQVYKFIYDSEVGLRKKKSRNLSKNPYSRTPKKPQKPKKTLFSELVLDIENLVFDYNLENEHGRVYSISQILEKYNCTVHTFYSVMKLALDLKMFVSPRRS